MSLGISLSISNPFLWTLASGARTPPTRVPSQTLSPTNDHRFSGRLSFQHAVQVLQHQPYSAPSSGLSTEIFSRSGIRTSHNNSASHKILVDNVVEGTYTVHYERNQAWAALRNVAVEHGKRLARHNMGERYRSERSGTGSMMNDCDGWPSSAPSWAQGDTY